MKFRSSVAGYITAIRFYKGTGNTGTHIGNIWSSTGTNLARVTFSGETATGWQQQTLATPVAVTPGTTYVVSYFAPVGRYAINTNYFSSGRGQRPAAGVLEQRERRQRGLPLRVDNRFPQPELELLQLLGGRGLPRVAIGSPNPPAPHLKKGCTGVSKSAPSEMTRIKCDELVKSLEMLFSVIPAKAGIKQLQAVTNSLDSDFRRSDDFLRAH